MHPTPIAPPSSSALPSNHHTEFCVYSSFSLRFTTFHVSPNSALFIFAHVWTLYMQNHTWFWLLAFFPHCALFMRFIQDDTCNRIIYYIQSFLCLNLLWFSITLRIKSWMAHLCQAQIPHPLPVLCNAQIALAFALTALTVGVAWNTPSLISLQWLLLVTLVTQRSHSAYTSLPPRCLLWLL